MCFAIAVNRRVHLNHEPSQRFTVMNILFKEPISQILTCCILIGSLTTRLDGAEALTEARMALAQWVEVEKTISSETKAWKEKKGLLQQMTEVAKSEVSLMKDELEDLKTEASRAEAQRTQLSKEHEAHVQVSAHVRQFLEVIEPRLESLLPKFPESLTEKLQPMMDRLSKLKEDKSGRLAARMQILVAAIAEIQRFDQVVTVSQTLITMPSGQTQEVSTIHFGLGASYFVSEDGLKSGVGGRLDGNWQWISQNSIAPEVKKAIAIADGRSVETGFISLPVTTQKTER